MPTGGYRAWLQYGGEFPERHLLTRRHSLCANLVELRHGLRLAMLCDGTRALDMAHRSPSRGYMASSGERPSVMEPSSPMPFLRRVWDVVPGPVRRQVVRLLGNPAIRLKILAVLRIRPESGFVPLSRGLGIIDSAMERVSAEGPEGDYYEFGLYRGYSFWHAQKAADRCELTSMRFFGFDSFEGLPTVEGKDKDRGIFFSGDFACTRQEVEAQLIQHGFDMSRAELVEGFYDVSLRDEIKTELSLGPAAVVLIDCDLYQSTVPVLHFLRNLIQDGTVMLFDDWSCFKDAPDAGEPRAFKEFLETHPEWRAEEWMDFPIYGKAFVMRASRTG